jgi:Putative zinc-finger
MNCWRFRLRRKMVPYLEGRLSGDETTRLERHLVDCERCRALLVKLRLGHLMAQRLALLPVACDVGAGFASGAAGPQPAASAARAYLPWWRERLEGLATPRTVTALSALVVLQLGLLVVSNRGVLLGERSGAPRGTAAIDFSDFRTIRIPDLKSNTQPHVATEGYVEDVHADAEEGTLVFKLFEDPQDTRSFVVCEIMRSISMAPPRPGARVRVYGVARYDAQENRRWYEVNPVLRIVPLKP